MAAPPTHIFLQAGVGSMAAAVAAYFAQAYPQNPAEDHTRGTYGGGLLFPQRRERRDHSRDRRDAHDDGGPCLRRAESHRLGHPQEADGGLSFLRGRGGARGMRALARPLAGDKAIVSGESGASTLGALLDAAADEEAREALGLDGKRAGAAHLHGGGHGPGELSEGDGGEGREKGSGAPGRARRGLSGGAEVEETKHLVEYL